MYDLIGDIHGQADELERLLEKMDYRCSNGVYQHHDRRVIFVGDFIDTGNRQHRVIDIARPMVEQGKALAVMGNHEFNALAFHTEDPQKPGTWLRPRNNKNTHQHLAFLVEYLDRHDELEEVLQWFHSLPLWLDLEEGLRVVHACWHPQSMEVLAPMLGAGNTLTPDLLYHASQQGSPEFNAVETLLKGLELNLPPNSSFKDRYGTVREAVRVKWWLEGPETYGDVAMPKHVVDNSPELRSIPIQSGDCPGYASNEPPVFFGHYWFDDAPSPTYPNAACLDYSVARKGGKLVAYRWSGEGTLDAGSFVSVDRFRRKGMIKRGKEI